MPRRRVPIASPGRARSVISARPRANSAGQPFPAFPAITTLHCKTRGEIAEALFIALATALGFVVSRPFGENCRYDFILDWHGRLSRVQLKSAWTRDPRGLYQIGCRCGPRRGRPYTAGDIDFLV